MGKRRLRGDLTADYNFLTGGSGVSSLWRPATGHKAMERSCLRGRKFRLDVREKLFTERAFSHWNRLSREAVTAPSLAEVKEHLDNALVIRFSFRQSCEEQGVGPDGPYGPLPI